MSLKFLVSQIFTTQCFFTDHLKYKTVNNSATMRTLVEKLRNWDDYFLRLSGFPDVFGEAFLITFKFS